MACKTRTKSMQISTRRPVSSWDLPIPSRKTKTKSAAINSDAYAEILFPKKIITPILFGEKCALEDISR